MDPVILTWRPQNMLTIFLMIVIISLVVFIIGQGVQMVAGAGGSPKASTATNPQGYA